MSDTDKSLLQTYMNVQLNIMVYDYSFVVQSGYITKPTF